MKKLTCGHTGKSKGPFRGRRNNRNVDDWEDELMNKIVLELEKGNKIKSQIPKKWRPK